MAIIKIPKGATLSGLARKYNTTVNELLKLNPNIKNPNLIMAGASLNVPDVSSQTIPESFKRSGITAPLGSPEATRQILERGKKFLSQGDEMGKLIDKELVGNGQLPPEVEDK